jgi:N-acetylmuramoyl-L-alanine amidase
MTPENIIIHHSLTKDSRTVSWGAIKNYHVNELGWRDIGYHFGIEDIDGQVQILTGRMMDETGAHCSQEGMNRKSIGICLVGNYDSDPVPPKIWHQAVRLSATLCRIFGIHADRVYGHRRFAGYKSCPGKNFDMDRFRADVASILETKRRV